MPRCVLLLTSPKGTQTPTKPKTRSSDGTWLILLHLKTCSHKKIRELNKVYTNGTLVDQELLTDEQAGHCISIREAAAEEENAKTNNSFGICVLDSSTSEFSLSAFEDDVCRTKLETMLRQLRPKEVIFKKVCKFVYLGVHTSV